MMTALTRNSSGSHGVNQSGCSFGPVSSIIVPSEDWCMVGSSSPSARIQTTNRLTKAADPSRQSDRRRRVGARPPFLEERRRELDRQHEHVEGDAERHLELRGVAPAPEEDRHLPQLPEAAEVHGDRQDGEAVAEEAGQHRRADERVVLALVQDVDEQRYRVAAAAERRARDHVERDPDAPGVAVVQVAHRAEAGEEAPEHHHAAQGRDGQEDPIGAGQDGPAHLGVKGGRGAHGFTSSPDGLRFRHRTAPSAT